MIMVIMVVAMPAAAIHADIGGPAAIIGRAAIIPARRVIAGRIAVIGTVDTAGQAAREQ
jgi:hypothetical protein